MLKVYFFRNLIVRVSPRWQWVFWVRDLSQEWRLYQLFLRRLATIMIRMVHRVPRMNKDRSPNKN